MSRSLLHGAFILFALLVRPTRAEEWLDRVGDHLTFSASEAQWRMKLGGLLTMEYFRWDGEPQGLIFSSGQDLWSPRVTFFADIQAGPAWYAFAQSRIDRGFDPSENGAVMRLDEYAVRWTPSKEGQISLQAGRFATVAGNWVGRHLAWDNPFINAPLAYELLTPVYDNASPDLGPGLPGIIPEERYEYNPLIWGPSYATGAAISGQIGQLDYALEIKNAGLSSRPESWGIEHVGFEHPTWTGRIGWRPSPAWNVGFSASDGPYLLEHASEHLPRGTDIGDYHQTVLAHDVAYAWHRWQIWAEVFAARFDVPGVGHADTLSYYLEAKYKLAPQAFVAVRWNQQFYDEVPTASGGLAPWGDDTNRLDAAITFRISAHSQWKIQYGLQIQNGRGDETGHLIATQFTVRF